MTPAHRISLACGLVGGAGVCLAPMKALDRAGLPVFDNDMLGLLINFILWTTILALSIAGAITGCQRLAPASNVGAEERD